MQNTINIMGIYTYILFFSLISIFSRTISIPAQTNGIIAQLKQTLNSGDSNTDQFNTTNSITENKLAIQKAI